jgi:hypothetical protein
MSASFTPFKLFVVIVAAVLTALTIWTYPKELLNGAQGTITFIFTFIFEVLLGTAVVCGPPFLIGMWLQKRKAARDAAIDRLEMYK